MAVAQLARYAQLKPRTIRACVLVLVQHNILWHANLPDEGEVLEVNTDECLLRLRFGGYVLQAEQRFGKAVRLRSDYSSHPQSTDLLHQAAEIVELVLDHGKLRPPDIIQRATIYDPKGASRLETLDCPRVDVIAAVAVYEQALHKLVSSHYLKASTVLSHLSPRDKLIRYEAEEKAKTTGFPTAKQLREARQTAEARIKREEADAEKIGMVSSSLLVLQDGNSVEPAACRRNVRRWSRPIASHRRFECCPTFTHKQQG